jgi:Flp pilus assembly protein TadD
MKKNANMLLTNTLSTPMIYYNNTHYENDDITLRYGEIKLGTINDFNDYFKAGVVALENKNVQMAISNFTKVLEMVPQFLPALNNMGALYYTIGRLQEAVYFFEQGIRKDPKNFQLRYNLGTLYLLNKNFDLAKNELAQAKSLFPEDPAINNNLGLAFLGANAKNTEIAEIFKNIVEKNENFDIALHNYAHVLYRAEMYDQAVDIYKKVLEKNKDNVITKNDLACCLYKNGNDHEALAMLQNIMRDTSYSFQPAVYNLGYIVCEEDLLHARCMD